MKSHTPQLEDNRTVKLLEEHIRCTVIKKLPLMADIIDAIPLSGSAKKQIMQDRKEICSIIEGSDKRLFVIVGPCSAWPKEAVLEYAKKLAKLNDKIKNKLKIAMRTYVHKPRTTRGWTGPVNQPDPFSEPDIEAGMRYTRDMMIKVIECGLAISDETLCISSTEVFFELLSWIAIGARSSEDQEHRIFASMAGCPVGMKNPSHGALHIAINSVIAAQHSHITLLEGYQVKTHGNPHAHLVLRGGSGKQNYSVDNLELIAHLMQTHKIKNPSIIVDASHDNCIVNGVKQHDKQIDVVFNVLNSLKNKPELKKLVKGFMVESFLKSGNQKIEDKTADTIDYDGLSITDPCIGWEKTEQLLCELAEYNYSQ